jgi:prevent-host-death family protein
VTEVSITELRSNLPAWIDRVVRGEALRVTRRGRVVARIEPSDDHRTAAREELTRLRQVARVGDVESPVDAAWESDAPA